MKSNEIKIYEKTMLFDIYGELLTEKQKELYMLYYLEDYSLAEIAEIKNISRQGVRDTVKKSYEHLLKYESKLHIMEKYIDDRDKLDKVIELLDGSDDISVKQAREITREMRDSL